MRSSFWPPLAVMTVLVAALAGCSDRGPASADRTQAAALGDTLPHVRLAPVRRAGVEALSFLTYLEADQEADLVAETEGEVLEVRAREGEHVAAGDTLVHIDDRDERLAVDRDEAELNWALTECRRVDGLAEKRLVSDREVEQAQLARGRAEASLGLSRAALDRCWVRAPIAGLVWMVRAVPHRRVSKGDPLCRVTEPTSVHASAYVPEKLRPYVRAGDRVQLLSERARGPMSAVIRRIDPVTDPASGTFRITASYRRRTGDPEPGADVRLVLSRRDQGGGVFLPEQAYIEGDGDSTWVWSWETDRVRRVPVRLGGMRDGAFQVDVGLGDGVMIVVECDRPLRDGGAVEVVKGP
jgi:membrane fusion protein, multidrug efflux system